MIHYDTQGNVQKGRTFTISKEASSPEKDAEARTRSISPETQKRFWSKVNILGQNDCWEWIPKCERYGQFKIKGLSFGAHRIAFILGGGVIGQDELVRHVVCRNTICCNPSHLKSGTDKDNVDDMIRDGTQARGDRHWARKHPEKVRRGSDSANAKITENDVLEIRRIIFSKESNMNQLRKKYGITKYAIWCIVNRVTWRHVL